MVNTAASKNMNGPSADTTSAAASSSHTIQVKAAPAVKKHPVERPYDVTDIQNTDLIVQTLVHVPMISLV